MLTFVIGDIHGQAEPLARLLDGIERLARDRQCAFELIFLGDLIDRGPQIVRTLRMVFGRHDAIRLKGNHEVMAADALFGANPAGARHWLWTGGEETLLDIAADLGIELPGEDIHVFDDQMLARVLADLGRGLPSAWRDWLQDERPSAYWRHVGSRFLAVHAGVAPDRPVAEQTRDTLIWIRQPFLAHPGPFADGRIVLHGHTRQHSGLPEVRRYRVNLDTGSFATGRVAAAMVDGERLLAILIADAGQCWRHPF